MSYLRPYATPYWLHLIRTVFQRSPASVQPATHTHTSTYLRRGWTWSFRFSAEVVGWDGSPKGSTISMMATILTDSIPMAGQKHPCFPIYIVSKSCCPRRRPEHQALANMDTFSPCWTMELTIARYPKYGWKIWFQANHEPINNTGAFCPAYSNTHEEKSKSET